MDEAIALELNGKVAQRLRLVRGTVVAARTGRTDRLGAGQFLTIVDPSNPGDCVVFKACIGRIVALSACPQELNRVAGWDPTDLHVGIREAA